MSRLKRIILMTLLYISLFAASFFLVSYFNGFFFLKKSELQLIAGVASLILSVIFITLLFHRSNYSLKDMVTVEESEEELSAEEKSAEAVPEMIVSTESLNEEIYETGRIQSEEAEEEPQQSNQLTGEQVELISEVRLSEQQSAEEKPQEEVILTEEDELPDIDEKMKEAEQITEEKPSEPDERPLSNTVSRAVLTVMEPIDGDPLTKTQINYINASANSYLNEEGMPQLVMTNDLSKEDIERRKRQYERPEEILNGSEIISHDEQVDEDFYVQDERTEHLSAVLGRIILLETVVLMLICGYYVYSRYLG